MILRNKRVHVVYLICLLISKKNNMSTSIWNGMFQETPLHFLNTTLTNISGSKWIRLLESKSRCCQRRNYRSSPALATSYETQSHLMNVLQCTRVGKRSQDRQKKLVGQYQGMDKSKPTDPAAHSRRLTKLEKTM